MKEKLIYAAALLIIALVGFLVGNYAGRKHAQEVEVVRVDTLTVTVIDTIRIDRPYPVKETVVEKVLVPVTDTLRLHDTAYVVLPRMQRQYEDSLYRAWVSGYDPRLDSIDIFRREQIIEVTKTVTIPPKKWHIGVTAGYGACLKDETPTLSPYLGIGVTYSLFSF